MRILLTHHMPLAGSDSGRLAHDLALGLLDAGHEVMCLVVQDRPTSTIASEPLAFERVVCRPGDPHADLAFDLPCLERGASRHLLFADLSDEQLVEYRGALRRKLDHCVSHFDPQVIHCQHAWLFAHLALESGVPYVITVHGPELRVVQESPRYRRFVEEALENAGRVLIHDDVLVQEIATLVPDAADRVEQIPPDSLRAHVACYEAVLAQRFGASS